ncbi:hemerythrin domain-containing protein [Actinomadura sp. B10D3]|uniref:hemerythrin domain-containing protein n=1 Tax=Actinomadura sp. B10D3 TaxID=3153557 RepID=UPI00325F0B43
MPDPAIRDERFPDGRHLVQAHDYLRRQLRELHVLLTRAEGRTPASNQGTAQQATLSLRRQFDLFCRSHCQVLLQHHTREDTVMFPHLRRADPSLARVLDRLEREHRTIQAILERVDRALAHDPGELRTAINLLTEALLAHLAYEEEMLVEPLSRHGG